MKESTIRQVIIGIIHGEVEITKESAEHAAGKGKEIMDFLKGHKLLYGNFIPDPPAPPKDRTPDNPIPSKYNRGVCIICLRRENYDSCVEIRNNKRYCTQCDSYVPGPRVIVHITPDTTHKGTQT